MVTLTTTEKITVIITTHYIEEARQAHVVGLMRHGRLLAEASPEDLLTQHGLETLEEVFLKLCMTDSSSRAAALAGSTSYSTLAMDSQQELHKNPAGEFKSASPADPKYNSALSVYSANSNASYQPGYTSTANLVDTPAKGAGNHHNSHAPRPTGPGHRSDASNSKFEGKTLTWGEYWSTTTALFWKNFTRLRRNIP